MNENENENENIQQLQQQQQQKQHETNYQFCSSYLKSDLNQIIEPPAADLCDRTLCLTEENNDNTGNQQHICHNKKQHILRVSNFVMAQNSEMFKTMLSHDSAFAESRQNVVHIQVS